MFYDRSMSQKFELFWCRHEKEREPAACRHKKVQNILFSNKSTVPWLIKETVWTSNGMERDYKASPDSIRNIPTPKYKIKFFPDSDTISCIPFVSPLLLWSMMYIYFFAHHLSATKGTTRMAVFAFSTFRLSLAHHLFATKGTMVVVVAFARFLLRSSAHHLFATKGTMISFAIGFLLIVVEAFLCPVPLDHCCFPAQRETAIVFRAKLGSGMGGASGSGDCGDDFNRFNEGVPILLPNSFGFRFDRRHRLRLVSDVSLRRFSTACTIIVSSSWLVVSLLSVTQFGSPMLLTMLSLLLSATTQ